VDVSGQTQLRCAACDAPLQDGDRFCEQCGARLSESEADGVGCRACGAPADAIDGDGYCSICGVRVRPAESRDELDLTIAAAVSDQGLVHRRNEDAFHLELIGERCGAAVVCDGISSASASNVAARNAAKAAGEMLAKAIADSTGDTTEATLQAIGAAQDAVQRVPWTTRVDRAVPSCTLVSAAWRNGEIVVGWVGDSRAYWLDADGAAQLTIDDSWAQEQIADGLLSAEEASRDPRFHSITNWVGADAPERPPQSMVLAPDRPGRLIVCTDGLWNYVASPAELGALVDALPPGAAPAAVARSLTDTALARGGRDNITVAVVDIDPS
jgi:serine/threonine protein phosphatase PrpC